MKQLGNDNTIIFKENPFHQYFNQSVEYESISRLRKKFVPYFDAKTISMRMSGNDPIKQKEFEETIKEFLNKEEISLIVCKRVCALLARRQAKNNKQ